MTHQRPVDQPQPESQVVPFYRSIDPWAPSIYQSILNLRLNNIQNIDDIELPQIQDRNLFLRSGQYQPQRPPLFQLPQPSRQDPFPAPQTPKSPHRKAASSEPNGSLTAMPHRPHRSLRLQLPAPPSPPLPSVRRFPAISWVPDTNQALDIPSHPPIPASTGGQGLFGPVSPPLQLAPSEKIQFDKKLPTIPIEYTSRPLPSIPTSPTSGQSVELQVFLFAFLADALPRQIYLHFLLRLPSLYFSRVDRIFTDADLTLGEIKDMALRVTAEDSKTLHAHMLNLGSDTQPEVAVSILPPSYRRLRDGWEGFIDNLIKEWKTLNIVSGLLVTAILTVFQIEAASGDPIIRYLAIWSLLCALMSLLYGCSYIIRFSPMRKAYKAAEWAVEARKHQTILWNVWVMLALPVIWLAWSIITFILCIVTFMWRSSAITPANFSPSTAISIEFWFRVYLSVVLCLGVLYGILISATFRKYGQKMDQAWKKRVEGFVWGAISQPTHITEPQPAPSPKLSPQPQMQQMPQSPQAPDIQLKRMARPSRYYPTLRTQMRDPLAQIKPGWQPVQHHPWFTPSPPSSARISADSGLPAQGDVETEHRPPHPAYSHSIYPVPLSRGPMQQFTTTHIPPQYVTTTYVPLNYMSTTYLDGPLDFSWSAPLQSDTVHPPPSMQTHHSLQRSSLPASVPRRSATRKGSVTVEDVPFDEDDGILAYHRSPHDRVGDNAQMEVVYFDENDGRLGSPSRIFGQDEWPAIENRRNRGSGSENAGLVGRDGNERTILGELWLDDRLETIDDVSVVGH